MKELERLFPTEIGEKLPDGARLRKSRVVKASHFSCRLWTFVDEGHGHAAMTHAVSRFTITAYLLSSVSSTMLILLLT